MTQEEMEVEPEVPEEEEEEEEDVSDLEQALEDAQETTNVTDRIPKLSTIIVNEKAGPRDPPLPVVILPRITASA